MKIKTEVPMDDLIVPKVVENALREFYTDGDTIKDSDKDFEFIFTEFWNWYLEDILGTEKDRLLSKDIADFVVSMGTGFCPPDGKGYPILNEFCFEDNGYKYNICTFGWQVMEGEPHLQTVGYKEKIIKKGGDKK